MDDAPSSGGPETRSSIPVPAPSQSGLIPVDGVCLYYELFGSGYPLVLVPGEVADSRIWNDQVEAFAEHYQVVRFDRRGSGRSESGTEPFTYVGDMATVLGTLQVDRAYLVGIADGATLAVEYALEYPHQVEALVLVNTTIRGYVPATIAPEALERFNEIFSHVTGATPEERLQQFIETSFSLPEYAPERPEARERARTIATEFAQRLLADPGGMERRQHAWLEPPAFQRLSEIHVPTLMVVPEPLMGNAPQSVEAVSQAIAGARVVTMPARSTAYTLDQPEAFNRIVLDFLDAINQPPRQ
ncbi:MAG: alpha/beta fold hydrolase [Ktedonobacterales bacterium]